MIHQRTVLNGLRELHGVALLWYDDWYDGPVTGLAMHEGREYWYTAIAEPDTRNWYSRQYVLHQLTADQIAHEWAQHRECAARTGIAGCLHRPACPFPAAGEADLHGWWDDHPDPTTWPYMDNPAIGWFSPH